MKKEILLFAAMMLSILAFRSAISGEYSPYYCKSYVDENGFTQNECSGVSTVSSENTSNYVDCAACCAQGRWVSAECARNCNQCQAFSDEAAAEARDFPS